MISIVAGSVDAASAWRRLVHDGALPESWLDDPQRRFVHDPGDRYDRSQPTRDPIFAPVGSHPDRIDDVIAIAADVRGVLAAEAGARALAAALMPWGAPAFTHVRWWSIPRHCYIRASTDTRPGVHYALLFAFNALHRAAPELSPALFGGHAETHSRAWCELAAARVRVRSDHVSDRTFADLPDPFEPLARIEAAGYATLEWIGATDAARGAVMLVSPTEEGG